MTGGSDDHCQLCGAPGRIAIAMLRVAWEARTIPVRACAACSAGAWRTVEELRAENYRAMRAGLTPPADLARLALRRLIAPAAVLPEREAPCSSPS
jgi:hypothetical protein